jgi:hypothetical protein
MFLPVGLTLAGAGLRAFDWIRRPDREGVAAPLVRVWS